MAQSPKTVIEILKATSNYLAKKGIEQSRLTCELLISRLLNCKRLELYLKFNTVLSDKRLNAMRRGVKRVADGEPIQYILRQADFMGHTFKVDRRALIPRPETEVLVQQVLQCEPLWHNERPALNRDEVSGSGPALNRDEVSGSGPALNRSATGGSGSGPVIVDIGTGSGCVVISLALEKPEALYIGLDASNDAVELARENAAAFDLEDKIAFAGTELSDFVDPGAIDAIAANLPYIPTAEYEKLPVHIHDYEPRSALDGGPDGLSVIEPVVQDAGIALKPGGFLFLEIGEKQGKAVTSLLQDAGFEEVAIKKDLTDRDRVVLGRSGSFEV